MMYFWSPLFFSNPITVLMFKLVSFLLLFSSALLAQSVTTIPAFPTENNPVTILFDATGSALENVSGDVYVHTGVIINEADISSGNWSYVIAPWPANPNDNLPKARMTSQGENVWALEIEDIRAYYGVPASVQQIFQLAIVFRNAGGSQQTGNIYVDLFTETVNVRFLSPQVSGTNPLLVSLGQQIEIEAVGNSLQGSLTSLSLFANDELIAEVLDADTLHYVYNVDQTGRTDFRIVASDGEMEAEDDFYLVVNPPVVDLALPEGMVDGINYHDDHTQVTLSLYAPFKSFVYVLGDFNNWELNDDYFMNRDEIRSDSVRYWITLTDLEPGREYAFQYFIDGELRIADPYTEKVLDPWNDQEIINKGVYPGLIPYPSGKTDNLVSVLQTGQTPYPWEVTDFQAPPVEELVIYELLVRDFIADHSYKTLADTLDYLVRLGVNAIELMPINQFEGNLSWGYNPSFFFAPDKYYGPRDMLKRFVDEAHKRGIAVILDLVWNHSFGLSPLLRMYFDSNNNRPSDENPWYHDQIFTNPGLQFGYKLNHGSPAFQEFMRRANRYWLEEYKVDGFRFDLTKGFTTRMKGNNDPWASLYDQERVDNLNRVANEIWSFNPNAYVILEHLADNEEERVLANAGMLLWGNLNHSYNEGIMGFSSDLRWGVYRERNWNDPNLITYMESHDEERLVFKTLQFGNSAGGYNTRNLETALQRVGLASAFFYTLPGPKMLWQFGEMGYDFAINRCPNGTINNNCRTDPKPIRWDYLDDPDRKALFNVTSDLIYLKRNYQAFNTTDFDYQIQGQAPLKRIRLNGEDLQVVVVGNFRVVAGNMRPEFYKTGMWYDYMSGDSLMVTDTAMVITLAPGEYKVYLDRKIDRPSGDVTTSTSETYMSNLAVELAPNPSHERNFYLLGGLDQDSRVLVSDVSGRQVYYKEEVFIQGAVQLELPSELQPGVYIVTVMNSAGFKSFKWILH